MTKRAAYVGLDADDLRVLTNALTWYDGTVVPDADYDLRCTLLVRLRAARLDVLDERPSPAPLVPPDIPS